MSDTIFKVNLPIVETDEELEKIKPMYSDYDPYFIVSGCCKERRDKFDKLWKKYKPYADSKFLTQIKTYSPHKSYFHQGTWEMYVGNILLEKGFTIKSKDDGPDFVVKENLYIECVAPTMGDPSKLDSIPEMFIAQKPEDICVQNVPVDKIILRITQVIKEKALCQYEKWKTKSWFNSKSPFVIAINTGDLSHVEDPNMPNVLKALFGFQFMQINIKTKKTNFSYRSEIIKTNTMPVPVNYFVNQKFSFVSGVLFSNKNILNHPENIGSDCIFVNNPFADNPVEKSFVELFKNWRSEKDDMVISLKKNY